MKTDQFRNRVFAFRSITRREKLFDIFLICLGLVGALIATTDAISRMTEDTEVPSPPPGALSSPPVPVALTANISSPVLPTSASTASVLANSSTASLVTNSSGAAVTERPSVTPLASLVTAAAAVVGNVTAQLVTSAVTGGTEMPPVS